MSACAGPTAGRPTSAPEAPANWPAFRGANPCGPAPGAGDPPISIDPARDVRYRVAVPAKGQSSPIIWGDRIYLTGEGDRIMAFDRATGRLLWDTALDAPAAVTMPDDDKFEVKDEDTGPAAPTAVADGRFVYAFFGDSVLGCVDADGKQMWAQRLVPGKPRNSYGLAASPVLYGELVIQVVDLGKEPTDNLSFIVAARAKDGIEVWRQDRPVRSSWSTPLIVRLPEGDTLITTAAPWVIAYDPATGEERWRAREWVKPEDATPGAAQALEEELSGDVAASPVVCGGLVIALSGESGELVAVRPGGKGNVTRTHVAWTKKMPMPDVASPVSDGKRYFHVSSSGDMFAVNPATGEEAWRVEMRGRFWASPVLVGDRIYAVNSKGVVYVVSTAGRLLAESKLGEEITTTPAFLAGRIYLRTDKHLVCVGK